MDYKVVVGGTRTFNDYALLERRLVHFLSSKKPHDVTIVSGGTGGADSLGEKFAKEKHCQLKVFSADWDSYRRNAEIVKSDACILFFDGKDKETKHMIDLAEKEGLNLVIVNY